MKGKASASVAAVVRACWALEGRGVSGKVVAGPYKVQQRMPPLACCDLNAKRTPSRGPRLAVLAGKLRKILVFCAVSGKVAQKSLTLTPINVFVLVV
jgi:hypothetical protein